MNYNKKSKKKMKINKKKEKERGSSGLHTRGTLGERFLVLFIQIDQLIEIIFFWYPNNQWCAPFNITSFTMIK